MGIKGYSAFHGHPPFHLVHGVVVDDLHCLYLGVVLGMLRLWFEKVNKAKPFYIGMYPLWTNLFLLQI